MDIASRCSSIQKLDFVKRKQSQLITNHLLCGHCADVAQLAEQLICNQQVIGSSPIIGFYNLISRGGAVWKLVGLITRRSQVQILPPLLKVISVVILAIALNAQIAQSVEQWTENPRVAGSIPALGIRTKMRNPIESRFIADSMGCFL